MARQILQEMPAFDKMHRIDLSPRDPPRDTDATVAFFEDVAREVRRTRPDVFFLVVHNTVNGKSLITLIMCDGLVTLRNVTLRASGEELDIIAGHNSRVVFEKTYDDDTATTSSTSANTTSTGDTTSGTANNTEATGGNGGSSS